MAEMILFIVGKSSFVIIVNDCDNGRHVNRGWEMGGDRDYLPPKGEMYDFLVTFPLLTFDD